MEAKLHRVSFQDVGKATDEFLFWYIQRRGIRGDSVNRILVANVFWAFHFADGLHRFAIQPRQGTTTLLQAFIEYHQDVKFLVICDNAKTWLRTSNSRPITWRTRPSQVTVSGSPPDFVVIDRPLAFNDLIDPNARQQFQTYLDRFVAPQFSGVYPIPTTSAV